MVESSFFDYGVDLVSNILRAEFVDSGNQRVEFEMAGRRLQIGRVQNRADQFPTSLESSGVKVMSWNVENGKDPRFLAAIEREDPDILLLQETRPEDVRGIVDDMNMDGVYASTHLVHSSSESSPFESGNAVLARSSIYNPRGVWLPNFSNQETKQGGGPGQCNTLLCNVNLGDVPVTVVSAHLEDKCSGGDRAAQLKKILGAVGDDREVIIGGDFNFMLGFAYSPFYGSFTEPGEKLMERNGFVDAHKGQKGTANLDGRVGKFLSGLIRLDRIYTRGLDTGEAQVFDYKCSDHKPTSLVVGR